MAKRFRINKILILVITIIFCLIIFKITEQFQFNKDLVSYENSEVIEKPGFQYIYSKSDNKWREYSENVPLVLGDVFVSKSSEGQCIAFSTSSYKQELSNKKMISDSGFSFIKNGQLYIYDFSTLTLSKVILNDREFSEKKLSVDEIRKIYNSVEIIKTSDFQNGYLRISKPFGIKQYIIVSDTDYYAYKYGFCTCDFDLNRNELPIISIEKENVKVKHTFFGDCSECDTNHPCLVLEFRANN